MIKAVYDELKEIIGVCIVIGGITLILMVWLNVHDVNSQLQEQDNKLYETLEEYSGEVERVNLVKEEGNTKIRLTLTNGEQLEVKGDKGEVSVVSGIGHSFNKYGDTVTINKGDKVSYKEITKEFTDKIVYIMNKGIEEDVGLNYVVRVEKEL